MRRDHRLIDEAARSLLQALGVNPKDSTNDARLEVLKGTLAEFYGAGFEDGTMLLVSLVAKETDWAARIIKSAISS